jgi:hypothetical protein
MIYRMKVPVTLSRSDLTGSCDAGLEEYLRVLDAFKLVSMVNSLIVVKLFNAY